ncbi:MAG: protein translocase subunit SecD [Candidatus Paceibacterota bacterium]
MFKHRAKAAYVLIFAALVGYATYASQVPGSWAGFKPFRLGLDLSGGTHLVYQADISKVDPSAVNDAMKSLRDVVERRVNTFGVSEPLVQVEQSSFSTAENAHKLIVELPGVTDVEEAAKSIGATPSLEFKLVIAKEMEAFQASTTVRDMSTSTQEAAYLALFQPTGLTGRMVGKASLEFTPTTNEPAVGILFNTEGRELFAKITKEHVGDYLGIFLDGVPISVPVIRDQILDGRGQISGSFNAVDASKLVRDLNYGALPVPITLISTQTIGPTLGQAAVNGGVRAGIISFILISIFLIVWYRLPGLVAVIALGVYTSIMLALFKYIPVTLTAAGIAGFIITIGMAVDANILIFERMKEELARGRGIWDAMHEGFARAWTSIKDSNISSIITGIILFYFGSNSVIKGFALVFLIGVLVSMFTAITASRLFLYAIAPQRSSKLSLFLINNGFKSRK